MDTIALYQILVDLGAEKEAAREALETLACEDQMATKTDIADLRTEIAEAIADLKISMIKWSMAMAGLLFVALGFLIKFP